MFIKKINMSQPLTTTQALLSTLQTMIDDVNEVNGTNEKIERLQKYSSLQPFLKLLYDPQQTTGVTSDQLKKYEEKLANKGPPKKKSKTNSSPIVTETLTELIEKLYERTWTGNEAKEKVLTFIKQNPTHKNLIFKIIDKDLETRLDVKQLNKAFPNLIVEFSTALAKDFDKAATYFKKNSDKTWFISRKFDGVRCLVRLEQGKVKAFSRNGNHFPALAPLEELLQPFSLNMNVVLDGEVCCVDEKGNENFRDAVSGAKRKSVRMEKYRFYVFDMLTTKEFDSCESKTTFDARIKNLEQFLNKVNQPHFIKPVEQVVYTPEVLEKMKIHASENNWEGLILRFNTTYKGKRSNDILKVKNFSTEEYKVLDYEVGPFRMISPETGLEVTIETLKSVIIEHKGCKVNVGSGFTLQERQDFYKNPKKIVGKVISVRYFEETTDANGKICSLRFPTFVALHGKKREV